MSTNLWRVTIPAHEIRHRVYSSRSFTLPASEHRVAGADERHARKAGAQAAHRASDIPPLRDLLRQTYAVATAVITRDAEEERQRKMKR